MIRVGAGIFYNRALLRTIDDFTLGAQQRFFDTNDLIDPATGQLGSADFRRAFIAANLRFPETLTVDSPLVQNFGVLNAGFSRRLDPALRIPESYQANVGFERDLGKVLFSKQTTPLIAAFICGVNSMPTRRRLPPGFKNFSEYLGSRDFVNFRSSPFGIRPLYNVSTAGDLVRFVFSPLDSANPNAVGRIS